MAIDPTTLLASAVVSALVSGGFGVAVFFLNRGEQRRTRAFEVKFQEYKNYLQALDDMSTAWAARAVALVQEGQTHLDAIVKGQGSLTEHLTAMNTALAGLTTDAITGMVNTRRELSGLRLIGSEPLVKLVDEYVAMHHAMTDRVADFMEQLKNQTLTAAKLTTWLDDGHRTEALHKKVVVQMRQDLETK